MMPNSSFPRVIWIVLFTVIISCSFFIEPFNKKIQKENDFFYLPLLEYKSLFDCTKEKLSTDEYENLNQSQKLLFELFYEVPDLDYKFKKDQEDLVLETNLPYLKSKLVADKDSSVVNNFIRNAYLENDDLILENKNYSKYYNSAMKSELDFEGVFMAEPIEYKAKRNKKIQGHKYVIAEHFYSKDYEGILIEGKSSYITMITIKDKKLEINDYESFLNLVRESLGKTVFDVSDDKYSVFYPQLEMEAIAPKKLLEGIKIMTKNKEYLTFGESIIKTNLILDSGGFKSSKSKYENNRVLVVGDKQFFIDDDFLICLLDADLALVNAIFVKKSMFIDN